MPEQFAIRLQNRQQLLHQKDESIRHTSPGKFCRRALDMLQRIHKEPHDERLFARKTLVEAIERAIARIRDLIESHVIPTV